MTPRFFQKIRDGKTFLIPFRRETPQPPAPAVRTFTHAANGRARTAKPRPEQAGAGISQAESLRCHPFVTCHGGMGKEVQPTNARSSQPTPAPRTDARRNADHLVHHHVRPLLDPRSKEAQMSASAERQARLTRRAKADGQERLGLWIPGDVHAQVKREARSRGITMRQRIIEKLRA